MSEQGVTENESDRCRNPADHYKLDGEIHDYFVDPHPVQADYWRRLRTIAVRLLKVRNGMHIVDVGSGGGWLSHMMRSDAMKVLSVDLSFKNLKRITDEYNSIGIMASATRLPIADESVDAVLASEVIEHLNNPDTAIKDFIRIVKPGGRVVITTPYKENIKKHLCIHCNKLTPANAHLHSFDEEKLTQLFSRGGANEIYYRRIGNKAFLVSRLSYILRWLPLSVWLLIDRILNLLIRKPAQIIVCGIKKGKR